MTRKELIYNSGAPQEVVTSYERKIHAGGNRQVVRHGETDDQTSNLKPFSLESLKTSWDLGPYREMHPSEFDLIDPSYIRTVGGIDTVPVRLFGHTPQIETPHSENGIDLARLTTNNINQPFTLEPAVPYIIESGA